MRPDRYLIETIDMFGDRLSGEARAEAFTLGSCLCRLTLRGWRPDLESPSQASDILTLLDAAHAEATRRFSEAAGIDEEMILLKRTHAAVRRLKFAVAEAGIRRSRQAAVAHGSIS